MTVFSDPEHEWTLQVGPGDRFSTLVGVLASLEGGPGAPVAVERLADLGQLLGSRTPRGRILLDADGLLLEDLGLVRRALDRDGGWEDGGWELVLAGTDPGAGAARRLLGHEGVRFTPWPLDLTELERLLAPPRVLGIPRVTAPADTAAEDPVGEEEDGSGRAASRPTRAAPASFEAPPAASPSASVRASGGTSDARGAHRAAPIEERLERELVAIETILREGDDLFEAGEPMGATATDPRSAGLELSREELEAFLAPLTPDETDLEPSSAPETPAALADSAAIEPAVRDSDSSSRPPPWYRAQVADLADIAQRLDLSMRSLREGLEEEADDPEPSGGVQAAVDRLDGDLFRLVQLVRTLGFLAAPPARGTRVLDLGTLMEEQLGGLAGAQPDSPRYLFRAEGEVEVRSDKALLVHVLDAILQVASACSGARDVVRVSVVGPAPGETFAPLAHVVVTFPVGPLAGVSPGSILEPYGLRRILGRIGPNALAAASRIVEGQGGRLSLGPDDRPDRLAFDVELPIEG